MTRSRMRREDEVWPCFVSITVEVSTRSGLASSPDMLFVAGPLTQVVWSHPPP
uniref:Uncharacterized protein n=1 Tax=Helianthus annuus TaxID=4232 RepID=A0A251TK92_HELAN